VGFYREYISHGEDERFLTDIPDQCGERNYPDFVDHMNDLSILTILKVKHDVRAYLDPSQWAVSVREEGFSTLINHHRSSL